MHNGLLVRFTSKFREKKEAFADDNARAEIKGTNQRSSTPDTIRSTHYLLSPPQTNRPQSAIHTVRCHSAATEINDPNFVISNQEYLESCQQHNNEDTSSELQEKLMARKQLDIRGQRAKKREETKSQLAQLYTEKNKTEERHAEAKSQTAMEGQSVVMACEHEQKIVRNQQEWQLLLRDIDAHYYELRLEVTEKKAHLTKEQNQLILELMQQQIDRLKLLLAQISNEDLQNKIKQFIIDFCQRQGAINELPIMDFYHANDNQAEHESYQFLFTSKRSRLKILAQGLIGLNVFRLAVVRGLQEINSCNKLLPLQMQAALFYTGTTVGLIGCGIYSFRLSRNTYCGFRNYHKTGSLDYFWRHKHEFINDVFWVGAGIMCFGMSTHLYLQAATIILGPGGIVLTAALYALDVINVSWQYYSDIKAINTSSITLDRELKNLRQLRDDLYHDIASDSTLPSIIQNVVNALNKAHILRMRKDQINDIEVMTALLNAIEARTLAVTDEQLLLLQNYVCCRQQIIYKKSRLARLPARIEFLHVQGKIRLGAAVGYLATISVIAIAVTVFSGPVAPLLVASTFMVSVCATEFYMKRVYLPRKEVELAFNPADLLHDKLLGHVMFQLNRLKDNKRNGSTFDRRRAAEKIRLYEAARDELAIWQIEEKRPYGKLPELISQVIKASMMVRKTTGEPSSAKHLRKLLAPFAKAEWKSKWKGVSNAEVVACKQGCFEAMKPLQLGWKRRRKKLQCGMFSYKPGEVKAARKITSSQLRRARFHPSATACA
ncbi:MAG: hypothetical protein P1U40_13740 [Coxiellaceae bacterium]|nr:hypothetical protein [Coxiellaceae bacterium]